MITDSEVKQLEEMPGGALAGCLAGDRVIVHNQWMLLDVPASEVTVTKPWPGKLMEDVRQWRYNLLPDGDGENAMVFRGEDRIRLVSDTVEAAIKPEVHALLYDILNGSPNYRLFAGSRSDKSPNAIAITVDDKIIGVIAVAVDEAAEGWLTVK
jgi:hypothetical protein